MEVNVAFKGYFRKLKYKNIKYSSIEDFYTQVGKLVGTEKVTRLEMIYLPLDIYVLLDTTPYRKPNSLGLRSNLIFVRESPNSKELLDIAEDEFEIINMLIEDKMFKDFYTIKGNEYYEVILSRLKEKEALNGKDV